MSAYVIMGALVLLTFSTAHATYPTGPPEISAQCPYPQTVNATLIANANDCTSYYSCAWGVAYRMQCPDGLYFDLAQGVCTYQWEAKCARPATEEPEPITDAPVTEPAITDAPITEPAVTDAPITNGPTTLRPPHHTICPVGLPKAKEPHYSPDLQDCRTFYLCDQGVPLRLQCPEGTAFDRKQQVCSSRTMMECDIVVEWVPHVVHIIK